MRKLTTVAAGVMCLACFITYAVMVRQNPGPAAENARETPHSGTDPAPRFGCLFLDPEAAQLGTPSRFGDGLVVGNARGELLVFHTLTQGAAPQVHAVSRYPISAPPLVADGVVYVGDENGVFRAFHPNRGVLWEFRTGNQITGGAVLLDAEVWVGSHDHTLYALDRETGALLRSVECDGQINATPVFSRDETAVYFGCCDGLLRKVEVTTGAVVGEISLQSPIPESPTLADGILYVLAHQGILAAIDAQTFEERYRVNAPETQFLTSPEIAYGILAAVDTSGKISVYASSDGARLATLVARDKLTAPQVLSETCVMAVSTRGKLYRWENQSGEWTRTFVCDFGTDFRRGCMIFGNVVALVDETGGIFYYSEGSQ